MKVMRTTVATVVAATLSMSAFSVFAEASLTGAGATFPAPVYAKWADTYLHHDKKMTCGIFIFTFKISKLFGNSFLS